MILLFPDGTRVRLRKSDFKFWEGKPCGHWGFVMEAEERRIEEERMASYYNDNLDPDQQITAEEQIAAYLFDNFRDGFTEEKAAEASRSILLKILEEFRPDLIKES